MATRTKAKTTTNKASNSRSNAASKRLDSLEDMATTSTIACRPLFPNEGEPNDVRVKAPKITENRKLMNTTQTGEGGTDAQAYDEMSVIGGPSDRAYPVQFEYTADGQADRKAAGQAMIPDWIDTGDNTNIQDPYAINRTTMDIGSYRGTVQDKATLPVPGYHKAPATKVHVEADNASVSMQSTGQVSIHSPISHGYRAG